MIWIYASIILIMTILWILAKRTDYPQPDMVVSYSKPFLAFAVQCHFWGNKLGKHLSKGGSDYRRVIKKRKISSKLHTLNPGENTDSQLYRYRVETISTIALIVYVGSILGLLISVAAHDSGVLEGGTTIYRNDYGGLDIEANLTAGIDSEEFEEDLDLVIPARVFSEEEAEELFSELSEVIDAYILGDNEDVNHIYYPINLKTQMDGYPFTINWECNNYEVVDSDGIVHNEDIDGPVLVTLTGDCVYNHKHWYLVRVIQVCPRVYTKDELIRDKILEAFDRANEMCASDDSLMLPSEVGNSSINWKERISDDSPLVILGVLIFCLILPTILESEIDSRLKKRSRLLLIEYPSFISKLTLFMEAGMSVRSCFIKMGKEAMYRRDKRNKSDGEQMESIYLDQELIIVANELEMGMPEAEVYERFGKRCGSREYMRFVSLLTQNLRKGSTDLIKLLSKEAKEAFEVRKNEARKLGEEASTKLLLPMVMMLAVVMIIIMVPAYMSFSS